jgi:putative oxygen-independent coproporphyrinogen III oxidase
VSAPQLPPLALYVHLPWCVAKCPYCDFNSHALRADLPERAYVRALLADLEREAGAVVRRPLVSVYFGGGTPSLFSAGAIGAVLEAAHAHFASALALEVTLEANPGTVEHGRFHDYRAAGVTRLSLGVQSFARAQLAALGRIHDDRAAHAAIDEARAAGFDNFNIDLMYGLPGQEVDDAVADVRAACAHGPAHVSHYQLTLEPGTPFHKHPPPLPEDDACAAIQDATLAALADEGFVHYEISGHAQPGRECVHNLNYWTYGDYLGIGAGAHGKTTSQHGIRRTRKHRHPSAYLGAAETGDFVEEAHDVTTRDAAFEFMLNALRLRAGFRDAEFEARTGCAIADIASGLAEARRRGLLERVGDGWRPTAFGLRFLNDLQALFLPEETDGYALARSRT